MQISIIIPTYNRVKDLDECLDSIISQTILPKEVIIVDDSTDINTKNIIEKRRKEFKEKGIILEYIKNNRENSLTIAKNIGIKHSTGDIISFLDDDLILDNGYYEQILKVYKEKPKALGVQGFIQNVKKGKRGKIYIMGCFISVFLKKNRCRVLPSLYSTYTYPIDVIINCERLSGASTYKKSILEEFKPDENLKKYSYKEDTDLSYRIFKKYPVSLFLAPHANYIHKVSSGGRNPKREIIYMKEIYFLYLFYKNIDQNLKNKLIYLWSEIGWMISAMISLLLKPSKSSLMKIKYIIKAYVICMRHIKEIKKRVIGSSLIRGCGEQKHVKSSTNNWNNRARWFILS